MDKTKELIETWKEIDKYLSNNDDAIYYGIDQYKVNEEDARKRWMQFTDFIDMRQKINEIIRSLEVDENATAH